MNRARLYHGLRSLGYYLPPLRDKSLTVAKMQLLAQRELITLTDAMISGVQMAVRVNKNKLKRAIFEIYVDPLPLWFVHGRLPSKQYLVNILYAFDPLHPLLGKTINLSKKRKFNTNDQCKRCQREVATYMRSLGYKRLIHKPRIARPGRGPEYMNGVDDLFQRARILCRSRHGLVDLKRRTRVRQLKQLGFDDLTVQAQFQRDMEYIDSLVDKLINLP